MKKTSSHFKRAATYLRVLAFLLFINGIAEAQNFPFGINYQAVVRDANGSAKTNTAVGVRLSILKGSVTGPTVYAETQNTVTNNMGQFNVVIGFGTPIVGTFSLIAWHTDLYFLKSEIQSGPGTYSTIGTQQLMSVPYALHARSVPPSVLRFTVAGTYTPSPGVSYLKVRMVGGGGGAASSFNGSSPGSSGGNGGATSFGTNLLIANGGAGGAANGSAAAGGTCTINSPAIAIVTVSGADGSLGGYVSTGANTAPSGAPGAASAFGGAGGGGGSQGLNGSSAKPNSGSGGGAPVAIWPNGACGGSGAAGAYIEAIIINPIGSYPYSVGTGGIGSANGGGSSFTGGNGGSGIIIVEEYY